jgi:hypothetical protein
VSVLGTLDTLAVCVLFLRADADKLAIRGGLVSVALHLEARRVLVLGQRTLGERLGVSARTVQRWDAGESVPATFHWHEMARAVHPIDPGLAGRLAEVGGSSLAALGLAEPPTAVPSGAHDLRHLADGVVCAAAESIDLSPRIVRTALLAAFRRARAMNLTMEDVESALAPESAARREPKKRG